MANKENFKTHESLEPVVKTLNEVEEALNNPARVIANSPISELLSGVLGGGVGGAMSFTALYTLGVTGLSAAGITSALAAAGAVVGGGMVAGIFVLAAPIAILATTFYALANWLRNSALHKEKYRLLKLAIEKQHAIIAELNNKLNKTKERADYLQSLNILLQYAIRDLRADVEGKTA